MRKNRSVALVAGALAVGGLTLSGCSQVAPKIAFGKAYGSTISQKDFTMKMSLKTTSADVEKLYKAAAADSVDPTQKALQKPMADLLPKLTMTTKVHSRGDNLDKETDEKKLDQSVQIAVDGSGIEVARVGDEAFFKADVDGLGQKTGLFTGTQARMAAGQLTAQLPWVGDLLDGKWIGVPVSAMDKLGSAKDANDPVAMKKYREQVQDSLERNASFEKTGTSNGGDDITVKVKLKPFIQDMEKASKELDTASPSANPTFAEDMKGVKDDAILEVKTNVKDDRVVAADIDIPQVWGWFDESKMKDKSKEEFDRVKNSGFQGKIHFDMSTEPGAVTKPQGARMLTESDLDMISKLGSGMGGGADLGGGADMGASPAA